MRKNCIVLLSLKDRCHTGRRKSKIPEEHLLASIEQSQQQKILAKAGDGGSQGKEQEDK